MNHIKIVILLNLICISSKNIVAQSIKFNYSVIGNLSSKRIDINKKEFSILGDSLVCQGETAEFSVSTTELAQWSNGINAIKANYIITKDTIIKAIVTNKYGCEFEKAKSIKVANLPTKPIIERYGDSLIVNNVSGDFEWYRNGLLFNVGLKFIRTSLDGNYTVKVTNNQGCESISEVFLLTSIEDINKSRVLVYPNPATSIINIESDEEVIYAEIYSLESKIMLKATENKINISDLQNGFYFIKIITRYSESVCSFIVHK